MALGGSLIEDIPDVLLQDIHRAADKGWTVQPLKADPESLLPETMGASDVATFSGHHQAIKDLGEGLQVTGIAPDGIFEAVEMPNLPWFIAVQRHPEITAAEDPSQQRLLDALVQTARNNKTGSGRSH